MTAVEDRLAEIEARARENWPTSEDVATLAAALRAVEGEAHPGNLIIGANAAWVAGYQDAMSDVRGRVADALGVTP